MHIPYGHTVSATKKLVLPWLTRGGADRIMEDGLRQRKRIHSIVVKISPRRIVPEAPPRRSTRLRGDPDASTSTASVDAESSTSADPVVPPGPVNADRLLHLDESKVRGTGDLHSSNSVQYNWGGATLDMLYRGLDTAFINNNINIGAPWLLLKLWWKWTTRHKSKKFTGPTRSGIEYARDVCMKMKPEHVVWRSYDHIRDRMPRCAQVEQRMFLLRIPCIHYWIVMWHHVDRIMHQFMLYQTFLPPPPEVNKWANTNEARVIEDRPWSEDIWSDYRRWLSVHGGAHLVRIPEGAASGPAHNLSYLRETPGHMNLVKHTLREALRGCTWVVKKGFRRTGKQLLKGCSTSLDIVGELDRLPRLLESKGPHSDIDSIPDTDDEDDAPEPGSVEEQLFMQV
ncbi:hypothetical protein LUZ63_013027 [Rhynchospora breviuscula]|uniref:Aminotransferase-like plant mobile domain-containing protein n=1 Tax=Rhynchospora breviuscula TaxID=2022672 RepID=A0A9Q0HJT6_9POAL|nr:hypothetical protein LUZ63_013027 [Rhynchospora breviuscula]